MNSRNIETIRVSFLGSSATVQASPELMTGYEDEARFIENDPALPIWFLSYSGLMTGFRSLTDNEKGKVIARIEWLIAIDHVDEDDNSITFIRKINDNVISFLRLVA